MIACRGIQHVCTHARVKRCTVVVLLLQGTLYARQCLPMTTLYRISSTAWSMEDCMEDCSRVEAGCDANQCWCHGHAMHAKTFHKHISLPQVNIAQRYQQLQLLYLQLQGTKASTVIQGSVNNRCQSATRERSYGQDKINETAHGALAKSCMLDCRNATALEHPQKP